MGRGVRYNFEKSSESVVYRVSKNILKIVNGGVKLCVGFMWNCLEIR